MLKYGNKEFRNLQEQVLKNMNDIQDMMEGTTVLAQFGIKVIGQVDEATDLPDPATYEGDYGDAFIVGTEEPYEYYIFTRAFEGQEEPQWFDLGIFPQPGPQGETGEQGPAGVTPVITATASTTTLSAGSDATVSVTKSGTDAAPTLTFAFGVPQGAQGIQGIQGPAGAQGPEGPAGAPGKVQSIVMNNVEYEPDARGVVTLSAVSSDDIAKLQRNTVVVKDAVTNINDYPSSAQNNYSAVDVSQGGYTITSILYNSQACTEAQAKNYMKYMTGSEFLPKYNYEQPQDCLLLFADGGIWKPQYDSVNGLLLYKLKDIKAVEANPTLSGTEASLTGLQVGNTKYKIPSSFLDISTSAAISAATFALTLTADQVTEISTNHPVIKLTYTSGTTQQVLLNFEHETSTSIYYFGSLNVDGTQGVPLLYSNGFQIQGQAEYNVRFVISKENYSVNGSTTKYIKMPTAINSIRPSINIALSNVSSGDTITNANIKNTIKACAVFQINNYFVYPMYRDSTNKISYYFSTISSSGNLVETVYEIDETTWVITFVTKTIS